MKNNILVIGSTGKLGSKLLNFCHKYSIKINAICCKKNINKLIIQKNKYKIPNFFCVSADKHKFNFSDYIKNTSLKIIYFLDYGSNSLNTLDLILKHQSNSYIAIANKEMLVAGSSLLIKKIKQSKNYFIPLDSEHFSLLNANLKNNLINCVNITASGGPFYFKKKINLNSVSKKQVLSHPKWSMGYNNLIDSSNFINKLLEIYELSSIFDIDINKIDFVISKEAFVHSIVHYKDSTISLNCFNNDMLIPLVKPLSIIFNIHYKNDIAKIYSMKSFDISRRIDKRFKIFKYFKKLLSLPHSERIKFMILNNKAQRLYLENKLQYNKILNFIIARLDFNQKGIKLNSFNKITNYIYSLENTL